MPTTLRINRLHGEPIFLYLPAGLITRFAEIKRLLAIEYEWDRNRMHFSTNGSREPRDDQDLLDIKLREQDPIQLIYPCNCRFHGGSSGSSTTTAPTVKPAAAVAPKPTPAPSSEECTICLEIMTTSSKWLPCAHKFHTKCIDEWLRQTPSCPVCRTSAEAPTTTSPPQQHATATSRRYLPSALRSIEVTLDHSDELVDHHNRQRQLEESLNEHHVIESDAHLSVIIDSIQRAFPEILWLSHFTFAGAPVAMFGPQFLNSSVHNYCLRIRRNFNPPTQTHYTLFFGIRRPTPSSSWA